jgi:regulator of cell morphogenesis and NO signaling
MVMAIDLDITVGDLVTELSARIPVLESFGIDYCCGGKRTLAEACRIAGRDPRDVIAALEKADAEAAAAPDDGTREWSALSTAELLDHIVDRHHAYLRRELPRLSEFVRKVEAAHGERHPELRETARIFAALRGELEAHLAKEEQILFPMIRKLEATRDLEGVHCGTVANPIGVMEMEHDGAGEALAELRRLNDDYTPPADGCASYAALLTGLADLERDLHEHIHKENNLLHPRALALEASLCDAARQ